jgi:hypothetical protein
VIHRNAAYGERRKRRVPMQELMQSIIVGRIGSGVMTALGGLLAARSLWEVEDAAGDERCTGPATAGSQVDEE